MKTVRIGLAGFGWVGSAVYRYLRHEAHLLVERYGIYPVITKIAVRNPRRLRRHGILLPRSLLVSGIAQLVTSKDTDIVVELIGGCKEALRLTLSSLRAGKPVVTANKALLAEHGREIFSEANRGNVPVYFEASVAGGIPIIKSLREGLAANRFHLIYGIVNGTCNYILTQMSQGGITFDEALQQARTLGYAEADPSLDIDGVDAAHKATVLASITHGGCVNFRDVYFEGIRHVSGLDIQFAHQLGYEIKLLAIIRSLGASQIEVRVHPTLIPQTNRLATIHGVTNAIMVRGHVVGDIEFSGPGAGGNATASAVLSDVIQAASYVIDTQAHHGKNTSKLKVHHLMIGTHRLKVAKIHAVVSRYYVRLSVIDRPGVMAQISSIFGKAKIGISSVIQPEGHEGRSVPLIFMIHDAPYGAVQKALKHVCRLECVKAKPVMIRVETFEA